LCETLKLDRSGESENPFAGLCRGSSGKHHSNRRDITDGKKSLRRQKSSQRYQDLLNREDTYSAIRRQKKSLEKSKSMDESAKSKKSILKSHNSEGNSSSKPSDIQSQVNKVISESDERRLLSASFDENAEWAEIANIVASFGNGIASESLFAGEKDADLMMDTSMTSKGKDNNNVLKNSFNAFIDHF